MHSGAASSPGSPGSAPGWATLRGWSKDERRGVFQSFNFTILCAVLAWQAASGLLTVEAGKLALVALPGTLLGSWLGAAAYSRLSHRGFDRVVLGLLAFSGATLVWTSLGWG